MLCACESHFSSPGLIRLFVFIFVQRATLFSRSLIFVCFHQNGEIVHHSITPQSFMAKHNAWLWLWWCKGLWWCNHSTRWQKAEGTVCQQMDQTGVSAYKAGGECQVAIWSHSAIEIECQGVTKYQKSHNLEAASTTGTAEIWAQSARVPFDRMPNGVTKYQKSQSVEAALPSARSKNQEGAQPHQCQAGGDGGDA